MPRVKCFFLTQWHLTRARHSLLSFSLIFAKVLIWEKFLHIGRALSFPRLIRVGTLVSSILIEIMSHKSISLLHLLNYYPSIQSILWFHNETKKKKQKQKKEKKKSVIFEIPSKNFDFLSKILKQEWVILNISHA